MTDSETRAHTYPTPRLYVRIAILLAIMTAVEVGLYYLEPVVRMAGHPLPARSSRRSSSSSSSGTTCTSDSSRRL